MALASQKLGSTDLLQAATLGIAACLSTPDPSVIPIAVPTLANYLKMNMLHAQAVNLVISTDRASQSNFNCILFMSLITP